MNTPENDKGMLDRMSLIYTKVSAFVITPLAVLLAVAYLILITTSYKKKEIGHYSAIPECTISLADLTPRFLNSLRRDFLTKTKHPMILDNPGYLKLLISLDTNISDDAGSCILYADLFEDCGCEASQNINMSRYIFRRETGNNNWGFVCSGIISLPHYFNPRQSGDKTEGGD